MAIPDVTTTLSDITKSNTTMHTCMHTNPLQNNKKTKENKQTDLFRFWIFAETHSVDSCSVCFQLILLDLSLLDIGNACVNQSGTDIAKHCIVAYGTGSS